MTEESAHNTIDFSRQYFLLRKKEGRIYSDQDVACLPEIDKDHQHYKEWRIRKGSSDRLIKYLVKKQKPLEILEVGCGNGWLAAKLSAISYSEVTAIDINSEELNQAKRVFKEIENLEFINCSLQDEMLDNRPFDIIVFAASVQYFSSLEKVLYDSLKRLKPGGEIHIIDSHIYEQNETRAARLRSDDYYKTIGFPELSEQYFHHSFEQLRSFKYDIFYDPNSIIIKLKRDKNPFYWVCIRNNA